MEQNEYRMRMLNIERLPNKATAKSIKEMIEEDKYKWREAGMTQSQVKDRMLKKLLAAHIATGEKPYYKAYALLHIFMQRERH